MAKKITSQDLFEGDIFASVRESVEQTIGKIQTLNSELTESAKLMKGSAGGIKMDSSKGQKEFNKFTQEANQLKREKIELEKQEAQLQALLNKAKQEELKAQKAANAEAERQAKAQDKAVKQAQAESSAYAQSSKRLNELRKAYKDLALQNKENTAEAQKLLTEIQDLDAELKRVDATVGQHQRNVGNYGEATQNLKKELRELTKALQTMESTDPRFQEMAQRAGELKDTIADTQAIVKSTAGTAVENLGTGLAKTGKIGVDAFAGITGAMGLMGIQSEGAMQTMAKLQELAALSEALNSLGALGDTMKEIQASFTAAAVKLGLFTTAKEVDTVVTEGQVVATNAATTSTNLLGKAMKALPIVAIVAGIAAIVGAFVSYFSQSKQVEAAEKARAEAQRKANEEAKKTRQYIADESKEYVGLIMQLKATNAGSKERSDLINKINSQYGTTLKNLSDEAAFTQQLTAAVADYLLYQKQRFMMQRYEEAISRNLQLQLKLETDIYNRRKELRKELEFRTQLGVQMGKTLADATRDAEDQLRLTDSQLIQLYGDLDEAKKRLENYGMAQLNLTEQTEGKYIPTTEKSTTKVKDNTSAVRDGNAALEERNNIIGQIEAVENEYFDKQLSAQTREENAVRDKYFTLIEMAKKYGLDTITLEIARDEELDSIRKKYIEQEKLQEKQRQENLAQQEEDYYQEYREATQTETQNQIDAINEKYFRLIELAKQYGLDTTELERKQAEELRKVMGQSMQKQLEERNKWAETVANYFIEQSNRKIEQIDKEKAAAESQFDYLKQLAAQGNIDAKESLAEQQRIIDEANAKKERELKRQQRIKLAEAIYSTYNSKVAAGSENPLMETMRDAALLQQFIMSLPTFFDGTEDTGTNGKGVDGKGGFHAILHPNERVIPKSLNDQIGGMSNEALAKLAMEYQAGKVMRSDSQIGSAYETAVLVNEMRELKDVIKNKPETNIELGEITQSVMQIVKSSKKGQTTIYNRYRIRP